MKNCVNCGNPVEHQRECYASPTCYACLPPPEPLPIANPRMWTRGMGFHTDPLHTDPLWKIIMKAQIRPCFTSMGRIDVNCSGGVDRCDLPEATMFAMEPNPCLPGPECTRIPCSEKTS